MNVRSSHLASAFLLTSIVAASACGSIGDDGLFATGVVGHGRQASTTTPAGGGGATTSTGCATAADCPLPTADCQVAVCEEATCSLGLAAAGTPCPAGQCDGNGACVCTTGADCPSGVCTEGACAPPTCADAEKNGAETDVDCGGICPKCSSGQGCATSNDCASGVLKTFWGSWNGTKCGVPSGGFLGAWLNAKASG